MPNPARDPQLPRLLADLAREADRGPLERRLLVAPTAGTGRELLRALGRLRGGWSGFAVTTARPLAVQLAAPALAEAKLETLDAFEEEARIDEALDAALDGRAGAPFLELAEGIGFRRAVREAVRALRLAGLGPAHLARPRFVGTARGRLVREVLRHFEAGLDADRRVDLAAAMEFGVRALDDGARLPADRVLLVPGLSSRGSTGRFVRALEARGARLLDADSPPDRDPPSGLIWPVPSQGAAAPTAGDDRVADLPLFDAPAGSQASPDAPAPPPPARLAFFRAAGVQEELREVLRRVRAEGAGFDEVEVVTPDPGVYGPALQTLASHLGIEVTYAVGLPVERTRPGRVVAAWFRWISEDYPSAVIRRLLENGDLRAPDSDPDDSPYLARELRGLRIGWRRDRWLPTIDAAIRRREKAVRPGRHEGPEEAERRVARELGNLRRLRKLVKLLLDAAPPARSAGGERVSPARLAAGLRRVLGLIEARSEVDRSALERMTRTLERIEAVLRRPTPLPTALATVREHLTFRVPAPRAEGRAPWISDGGAIHLSDLEHGGRSGRRLTFVVGLDQDRFPGSDRQDPILLDADRRALGLELPVSEDRMRENEFRLLALIEGLRGEVVLSCPAWEAAEGRALQPSRILLHLHRRTTGRPETGYEELIVAMGAPVSRIPRGTPAVDVEELWLEAMAGPQTLRSAKDAVRHRFGGLDRGLTAYEGRRSERASPHVGVVDPVAALDPTSPDGPVLSASALEAVGACPLRYFYGRVLRVSPPDDPEFDVERWLPPRERGLVLHDTFDRAVERARTDGLSFDDPAFERIALEVLDAELDRMEADLPPPSASTRRLETGALREDVRSWVRLLVDEGTTPDAVVATEFSLELDEGPVPILLPGGDTIRVRGRIDRIDRTDDGLRIVDYKTGSDRGHEPDRKTFDGGRRLQHLLYAAAIDRLREAGRLDDRVARVEYHFATARGENAVHRYDADRLEGGLEMVEELIAGIREGRFVPTDDPNDCRWCDFKAVCRFGEVTDDDDERSGARVEWSRARGRGLEEATRRLDAAREFEP